MTCSKTIFCSHILTDWQNLLMIKILKKAISASPPKTLGKHLNFKTNIPSDKRKSCVTATVNKGTYNWMARYLCLLYIRNASIPWELRTKILVDLYICSWKFMEHCLLVEIRNSAQNDNIIGQVSIWKTRNFCYRNTKTTAETTSLRYGSKRAQSSGYV